MEYVDAFTKLISGSTLAFMSPIGYEFFISFVLNHHSSSGLSLAEASHSVSGKIQTQIRKLLHLQKSRDSAIEVPINKSMSDISDQKVKIRSVFFSFVQKLLLYFLQKGSEARAKSASDDHVAWMLSLLHTTMSEVVIQMSKNQSLPFEHSATVASFLEARVVQVLLKQILNSITMAVMSKRQGQSSLSEKEEHLVYNQFVEDFLNLSLLKEEHAEDSQLQFPNLLMLMTLPVLMHGSFIAPTL